MMNPHIDDFTEANYRRYLGVARKRWEFSSFRDFEKPGNRILWRHDVDFSLERSLVLAVIEADVGVQSTYFLMLNSWFYNLLEEESVEMVAQIAGLGHEIGIHLSPAFYAARRDLDWEEALGFEIEVFRRMIGVEPTAFSIHNPDVGPWLKMDDERVRGLVNTYGKRMKEDYRYCSDSNGYWRFDRLPEVLATATEDKLHVLTHPGWWVPEPAMPRDRIQRVIDDRASETARRYDAFLEACGRRNVT